MALDSKIEWTHHTANLWWGCTNVHEGCDNCYAEKWANRYGVKWGNDAPCRLIYLFVILRRTGAPTMGAAHSAAVRGR